jgi:hypothetical protein
VHRRAGNHQEVSDRSLFILIVPCEQNFSLHRKMVTAEAALHVLILHVSLRWFMWTRIAARTTSSAFTSCDRMAPSVSSSKSTLFPLLRDVADTIGKAVKIARKPGSKFRLPYRRPISMPVASSLSNCAWRVKTAASHIRAFQSTGQGAKFTANILGKRASGKVLTFAISAIRHHDPFHP